MRSPGRSSTTQPRRVDRATRGATAGWDEIEDAGARTPASSSQPSTARANPKAADERFEQPTSCGRAPRRLHDEVGVGDQPGELGRSSRWRVQVEFTGQQQGRRREGRQRGTGGVGVEGGTWGTVDRSADWLTLTRLGRLMGLRGRHPTDRRRRRAAPHPVPRRFGSVTARGLATSQYWRYSERRL